jgi:hypothetical protein
MVQFQTEQSFKIAALSSVVQTVGGTSSEVLDSIAVLAEEN